MNDPEPPAIVLDTNVVLDWLVFHDPSCAALGRAIVDGRVRWLADAGMLAECRAVLLRGVGASRSPDLAAIDDIWHRHARMRPRPADTPVAPGRRRPCRCTDPDDQAFIDLALHSRARWLLSRDRAVLALAREARAFGLAILTPTRWTPVVTAHG